MAVEESTMIDEVYSQVTDPKLVRERRSQIVAAAVKLFSEEGYYRTTIQKIAREAGVSPGLIYQYVKDKDDVLYLSLKDIMDSYCHEIPLAQAGIEDPVARLEASVRAYCKVVDQRKTATVLAYRTSALLPQQRREAVKAMELKSNQLLSECISQGIEAGYFSPELNIEIATYQCVMFCHTWALKYWRLKAYCNLDQYLQQGLPSLLNALLSAAGREHYDRLKTA